ncbi:porin [Paracoccus aestuariivivens]|uniref:Porin n=1 Tax=Paracoccus aestuariivivens TaxID=1820333 RepID=A0A6L6J559_9RHOB|nr:porin [Paracoccus aestuariivivens]MTH77020.1 porin [Paracoccus aestuariivivens]
MKTSLFIIAPGLCLAAIPAWSEDLTFTHPSGATATFYGQVNLTYQRVDDGEESFDDFVDNGNSVSRLGFWVDVPMGENQLRLNFETGLGFKTTSDTNQIDDPDWVDWQRTDLRKFEAVYIAGFGSFWFGQGSMATDGVAEIDNSGTSLAGYVNLPDMAGGYEFRDGELLSGIAIGDVFKDFDGGRRFRLRYDTPKFNGFMFSAAYGEEILAEDDDANYYDVALRYGYENDTFKADAGLGYAWKDADDDGDTEQLIASTSVVHRPTGLNATLAMGDGQDDSGNYGYFKFGWTGDVIDQGSTAVSIDYFEGNDYVISGSDSKSWGIQAVQGFDDYNVEAYLGYREYEFDDDTGADYQDISALLLGARWKF